MSQSEHRWLAPGGAFDELCRSRPVLAGRRSPCGRAARPTGSRNPGPGGWEMSGRCRRPVERQDFWCVQDFWLTPSCLSPDTPARHQGHRPRSPTRVREVDPSHHARGARRAALGHPDRRDRGGAAGRGIRGPDPAARCDTPLPHRSDPGPRDDRGDRSSRVPSVRAHRPGCAGCRRGGSDCHRVASGLRPIRSR